MVRPVFYGAYNGSKAREVKAKIYDEQKEYAPTYRYGQMAIGLHDSGDPIQEGDVMGHAGKKTELETWAAAFISDRTKKGNKGDPSKKIPIKLWERPG